MELKVWVEGIQRIVCGVTVNTTCQDVVFALAHATGKVGRFTLIERWRNNERLLAPQENPLKLLLKWGEYANDVQFILQRSESKQQQQQLLQQQFNNNNNNNSNSNNNNNKKLTSGSAVKTAINNDNNNNINNTNNSDAKSSVMLKKPLGILISNNNNNNNNNSSSNNFNNIHHGNNNHIIGHMYNVEQQQSNQKMDLNLNTTNTTEERRRELKKSFGAYDGRHNENVGIVKGIPQRQNNTTNNQRQQQQQQHQQKQLVMGGISHKSISSASPNTSSVVTKSPAATNIVTATALAAIVAPTTTDNNRTKSELLNFKPKHEKSHSNPVEMQRSHQQQQQQQQQDQRLYNNMEHSEFGSGMNSENSGSNNIYNQLGMYNSKSINEINLAVVRSALDHGSGSGSGSGSGDDDRMMGDGGRFSQHTQHRRQFGNNNNNSSTNNSSCSNKDLYNNSPAISANGALVPPPYRDPPPPRNSPMQQATVTVAQQQLQQQHQQRMHMDVCTSPSPTTGGGAPKNSFSNDYANYYDVVGTTPPPPPPGDNGIAPPVSSVNESEIVTTFQATQYNDLLQLIKFQREKISAQQMELSKYDAEIVFLEGKERDQAQELDAISLEISKADQNFRQGSEQLQTLQYVEEENELVKQQEKTLKSEIALLRSKLANCETELLQCKNKIRLLMDDIEIEQRALNNNKKTNRQNVERDFLMEMERIQSEIDQAIHTADNSNKTTDNLKKEIMLIESAIAEKKRQVEQLVNEMKEVNLQSLTVTTSEEIKHFLEGPHKPGSTRRIIGSPRQLENAVPTSKNPHGVWV